MNPHRPTKTQRSRIRKQSKLTMRTSKNQALRAAVKAATSNLTEKQ